MQEEWQTTRTWNKLIDSVSLSEVSLITVWDCFPVSMFMSRNQILYWEGYTKEYKIPCENSNENFVGVKTPNVEEVLLRVMVTPRLILILVGLIGVCLLTTFLLPLIFPLSGQSPPREVQHYDHDEAPRSAIISKDGGNNKLAVIVPFRERFEELLVFAPHLHHFLRNQGINHHIWVINQVDTYRFNRAALINAGFLEATKSDPSLTYLVMHDVDLLPLNPKLSYASPGVGTASHVASLHPKYNYPSFIGGVLILTVEDFQKVDGMSNIYWGWGMEDDELWVRLRQGEISVQKMNGKSLGTGRKDTFKHIHSPKVRPRDMAKCFNQREKTKRRDRVTGLRNVNYTLLSSVPLTVDGVPLTVLNVQLHCDTTISPWCSCPPSPNGEEDSKGQNAHNGHNNNKKEASEQEKERDKAL